ncbi:cytochrome c oxidase subunit 3 [Methylohalomonas lacus]|uniref:cytochrome-c oxidase n=1 Tax=Methylohalomonas lacus TaxID=398773 RepID=A0AAE3HJA2_9GAMM|nr:cytochrome c oxidase subunit 3 [Methylohalomonas lacus]MCS3903315.1 cytochrome c oxidase subunit 3 [Methylohalomonas lacus]
MSDSHGAYYVPQSSHWPIVSSIALFCLFGGTAMWLNDYAAYPYVLGLAVALVLYFMFGWFGEVIRESETGKYNHQVDVSFRWSMGWFIFSEVMFFAAFFGALFYARMYAGPWLGGEGKGFATNEFLWPEFAYTWPMLSFPEGSFYSAPSGIIGAWGLPAINTLILLTSGATITFAHWALVKNKRSPLVWWLAATVALGVLFIFLQGEEYIHAYQDLGLTLNSGIYGATFFLLTGFHGFHVSMGALMIFIIMLRAIRGHFTPENHFAFEAVAWYWHFVDVVWLFLFIFVYWL